MCLQLNDWNVYHLSGVYPRLFFCLKKASGYAVHLNKGIYCAVVARFVSTTVAYLSIVDDIRRVEER